MRSNHSFSVDFVIRKCKADKKKAFIYARITVDGEEPIEISSKEKIDSLKWDNDKEIVRGNSVEVKAINKAIDEMRFQIKGQYRMLRENAVLITAEKIKDAFLGIHSLQKGHTLVELVDYYKKIWELKLKEGGFKNYKTTIAYIKLFLAFKYPSKDIYLSQLNTEVMTEFEYYIRNNPIKDYDPCKGNGLAKHIQRFKRILNWAADAKNGIEWMKTNPCEKYSCPIKKSKRKKLDIQQLVTLEQKNFQDANIQFVKELFLFSCYSGFAYADVMALNESHFEWDTDGTIWCKIYRLKSDILAPIPLLKDAAEIINRYKGLPAAIKRNAIFPYFTNKHINDRLKIIQEACEITIPLTFHVGRHTFAKTVALKNGIPLETVQIIMGHTKITTTQIYADVDEEKVLDDMSGLEQKLRAKRAIVIEKWQLERSAKLSEIM